MERHSTGEETELWEIVYFKVYKSQLPVIEKAIETAGLMLGNHKSRGYCLEMIAADLLAGANVEENGSQQAFQHRAPSKLHGCFICFGYSTTWYRTGRSA
jgi:hypothetical protein